LIFEAYKVSTDKMASKKIDKEFRYTDDTVNVYGFRLLTSGYLIDDFKKNPIGFYMHGESPDCPREAGVLVLWEDFRIEGDAVYAKPVINLNHPRGEQTVSEIEDGFLNGASVGKIIAIEVSDDPALMLPGQTGPTVTKWTHRELSLVDIPGNLNALSLFDKDGKAINLADFKTSSNQPSNMKQIFLTPELIAMLGLSDSSDQSAVNAAIKDLSDKAKTADGLKLQLDTALADKATAVTALETIQKEAKQKEVTSILDKALADRKVTKQLSDKLAKQYEGKPDELKDLVDAMQPYQSVTESITKEKSAIDEKFNKLSYQELDKAGLLPALKEANIELFKQKFKDCYNTEYKG
jgi:hypothetical protein